jgi:hypothetical protein
MGLEKDLAPGEHLVTLFRPFLEHLAASNLSPKTIQKHVDNMWVLGGEFIRDLHNDPPLRKRPVDLVLSKMIEYGGPPAGKISKDRSGTKRHLISNPELPEEPPQSNPEAHAGTNQAQHLGTAQCGDARLIQAGKQR